jgi:hypothetical protein
MPNLILITPHWHRTFGAGQFHSPIVYWASLCDHLVTTHERAVKGVVGPPTTQKGRSELSRMLPGSCSLRFLLHSSHTSNVINWTLHNFHSLSYSPVVIHLQQHYNLQHNRYLSLSSVPTRTYVPSLSFKGKEISDANIKC